MMSSPVSSSSLPSEWNSEHDLFMSRLSIHPDLPSFEDIIKALREKFPELGPVRLTETAIDVRLQILEFRGAGIFADIETEPNDQERQSSWQSTDSMSFPPSPRAFGAARDMYCVKNESEPALGVVSVFTQRFLPKRSVTCDFLPRLGTTNDKRTAEIIYLVPAEEFGIIA